MFGLLGRCQKNFAQMRRQRLSARSLAALEDWQLKDIGVHRGDIQSIAAGLDRRFDHHSGS